VDLGYVVWEVDGFDFGSAEVADTAGRKLPQNLNIRIY